MKVFFPASLTELWHVWQQYPHGILFAGGTDVFVRRRRSGAEPDILIGLERLPELSYVRQEGNRLRIGAAVCLEELRQHPAISALAAFKEALDGFASPPIRHCATIGGNICTASPAADLLPPLYILDAVVRVTGAAGSREVAVADFFLGPGRTALQPGEIVTEVIITLPDPSTHSWYRKIGKRRALAIAVASLAGLASKDETGRLSSLRLAWGSMGPTVVTIPHVEQLLTGCILTAGLIREAALQATAAVHPIDDLRATARYRQRMTANLLVSALQDLREQ